MNVKRFILASLAVFVAYEAIDTLVNMVLLTSTYDQLKQIWRPDMMQLIWIMYLAYLIFSFLFVFIFTKGYEGKGIMEGVRYGLYIGLMMCVPGAFSQYVVYPLPFTLALQWFIYGMIEFSLCGVVVALVYKPKAA